MSLILDALNRADQERSEENNQINLHASHSPVVQNPNPVRRWVIEAVIVVLAISAFLYSQWQPVPAAQPSIEPVAELATITTADTATPKPVVKAKPIKVEANAPLTANHHSAGKETIASLYQQQSQGVDKAPIVTPAQPATRPMPDSAVDTTRLILQQIPLLTAMSAHYQRTIPSIDYGVHMYAEGGKGFVNINGSVLKTGAVTKQGLRVIAVLPDSVVLEFKGKQFRLPALNSWVNYN